jgi:hypothetical protein
LVDLPRRISLLGALSGGRTRLQGEPKSGVEILLGCLEVLHAARYELLTTAFNVSLVQGLAAIGPVAEGMAPIDETIGLVEANGDLCYMPELLRVKGLLFRSMPQPHVLTSTMRNCS